MIQHITNNRKYRIKQENPIGMITTHNKQQEIRKIEESNWYGHNT